MIAYSPWLSAGSRPSFRGLGRVAWIVLAAGLLGACSKPADSTRDGKSPAVPPAVAVDDAKGNTPARHPIVGEIISVEPARKALIVKHEEIKGFMPAMTMEFLVSPGDLAVAKPGQRIRGDMVIGTDGEIRLEKMWPAQGTAVAAVAAGAQALRQDTLIRGKAAYREVGEIVPEFTLFDQSGGAVSASRFRGKQVMINFIYTRCPIANMCPAATAKMMATQALAREAGVTNIEFLSITLDAAYDTPGVLREYAEARGIDTKNFTFLTGPETAIKDLLEQFGVIARYENEFLVHTLSTLLVDANGKIIHRADGKEWDPKDFVAKMRR